MEYLRCYRSSGIAYYLPVPWPETFSLIQISTLQKFCKEFSHSTVAQHIGKSAYYLVKPGIFVDMENQWKRLKVLAREQKQTTNTTEQPQQQQASTQHSQDQTGNVNASTATRTPPIAAQTKARKTRHVPEKTFDISLTIEIPNIE
ncbi:hypothetical protein R1sor_010955 [Riccia sorocarpa]|uniref:Uncharacterized protein n=1 Tax=Riccia sorocarpa TaxID=122646 RepID=A0ABD3I1D1_9MARC